MYLLGCASEQGQPHSSSLHRTSARLVSSIVLHVRCFALFAVQQPTYTQKLLPNESWFLITVLSNCFCPATCDSCLPHLWPIIISAINEKHLILGPKYLSSNFFFEMDITLNIICTSPRAMPPGIAGNGRVNLELWYLVVQVRHCALSLVGEPIMYPEINAILRELHQRRISSFLVTNAQFPDRIRHLVPITQLYVSVDAATRDTLKVSHCARPPCHYYNTHTIDFVPVSLCSIDTCDSQRGPRHHSVRCRTCLQQR